MMPSGKILSPIAALSREVVVNLIRRIDFLGMQISHAQGLLDDDELEHESSEYFSYGRDLTADDLEAKALLLSDILEDVDVDSISLCLGCDYDVAFQLIDRIVAARKHM